MVGKALLALFLGVIAGVALAAEAGVPVIGSVIAGPAGEPLVAGTAPPGAKVELLDGGRVIGRGIANQRGEWLVGGDGPLPAGTERLTVRLGVEGGPVTIVERPAPLPPPPAPVAATPSTPPPPAVAAATPPSPPPTPKADVVPPRSHGAKVSAAKSGRASPPARLARKPKAPTSVTVRRGDSLWTVAERLYGDGALYPQLLRENSGEIGRSRVIQPGQVLALPKSEKKQKPKRR